MHSFLLSHSFYQTLYPNVFRSVSFEFQQRIRLETNDGDFIDLDVKRQKNNTRVAVLTHGLEGNSKRPYILGMAKALWKQGYTIVAWNFRGCSGTPNRLPRMYHAGETGDLETVIQWVCREFSKANLHLIGFSMGGNITLKYLGDKGNRVDRQIKSAVAVSAPFSLEGSSLELAKTKNIPFAIYFLAKLFSKLKRKKAQYPTHFSLRPFLSIRNLIDFDNAFTAPLHGFDNATHYYRSCSSLPVLHKICVPTLILNAQDDSFLGKESFKVIQNELLSYDFPKHGGHVGFLQPDGFYYSEVATRNFLARFN